MTPPLKALPHGVRVFVATENRLMRESLGRVLGRRDSLSVTGTAPLSADVRQLARASGADVVVVDGQDPLAQRIIEECAHQAGMRVMVIGIQNDEESFLRIVRAGAAGVILDEADVNELIASIKAVSANEAVCSRKLVSSLFHQVSRQNDSGPQLELRLGLSLSRRERQLLPLIARLLTNKEIAEILHISEQPVKNHIHNILRKTDLVEATVQVLEAPARLVSGEVFNVGDTRLNHTLKEVSEVIRSVLPDVQIEHVDNSDRRNYRVNFDKLLHRTGFRARYTLRDGVEEIKRAFDERLIADYTDLRYHNQRYLKAVGSPAHKDEVDTLVMAAFSNHRSNHSAVATAQAPFA